MTCRSSTSSHCSRHAQRILSQIQTMSSFAMLHACMGSVRKQAVFDENEQLTQTGPGARLPTASLPSASASHGHVSSGSCRPGCQAQMLCKKTCAKRNITEGSTNVGRRKSLLWAFDIILLLKASETKMCKDALPCSTGRGELQPLAWVRSPVLVMHSMHSRKLLMSSLFLVLPQRCWAFRA